jgi:DnaJ-class molecular chaperone|tara:strand:+ start:925 stop:1611 length:687 start_codon:yes stop_codon:yes gene_type:complete
LNTSHAHQILSVDNNASFDEVKYSYRKLVLQYHPDKNKNSKNDVKFKKATEAYHYLKNQNKHSNSTSSFSKKSENNKKKNQKTKFYRQTNWGSSGKNKTPEEDWSKFTQEFEENKDWWKQYEKKFWEDYDSTTNQSTQKEEPQQFKTKTGQIDLGVQVDESLCIGCCSCETIAPGVFSVDKTRQMNPKSHVHNRKGGSNLKILNAAETCPTKAIQVDDLDEGKRLFPY